MPRIPVATEQTNMNVSSPVPIRTAEAAGAQSEALASFGRSLITAGGAFQNRLDRQQEAEDILRERNAKDSVLTLVTQNKQLALRTDGKDYVGEFDKATKPELDKILTNEQNPRIKSEIQSFANSLTSKIKAKLFADQLQTNEQRMIMQVKDIGNQAADRVFESPELAEAELQSLTFEVFQPMQSKQIIQPELYTKLVEAQKNTIATRMVEGLLMKKQYGRAANFLKATMPKEQTPQIDFSIDITPSDARDIGLVDQQQLEQLVSSGENYKAQLVDTKGEKLSPGMTEIINSLTPVQKKNFLQRIQSELKAKEGMRIQDLNAKINSLGAAIFDGVAVRKEDVQEVLTNIDSMKTLPEIARNTMKDTVLSSVQIGQAANLMAKSNPEKWNDIVNAIQKPDDSVFNYANRKRHMQTLGKAMQSIIELRKEDPVSFVLQHVPETQDAARAAADGKREGVEPYLNSILGAQKALGISASQQKLMTKSQALEMNQKFESASSPEETVFLVQNLKNTYGKHYTKAMMEIAGKNTGMQDLVLFGYTSSPDAELRIASNIKNRAAIREEWTKRNPTSDRQFNNFISATLDQYRGPLSNSFVDGASALGNAFFEQVKTEAQRKMNMNQGMNISNAINSSAEEIVGRNFNISRGGNSELLIPKRIGNARVDSKSVDKFLNYYSTPENIGKLGVYTPTNQRPELWHSELASNSRWVMNSSMTGFVLAYTKAGQTMVVVDKNKRPIERSIEQVQKESFAITPPMPMDMNQAPPNTWWGF